MLTGYLAAWCLRLGSSLTEGVEETATSQKSGISNIAGFRPEPSVSRKLPALIPGFRQRTPGANTGRSGFQLRSSIAC